MSTNMTTGDSPLAKWEVIHCPVRDTPKEWRLLARTSTRAKTWRVVAIVWRNGTWHTFDRNGSGGENSSESTIIRAKTEAAASAINQGFI